MASWVFSLVTRPSCSIRLENAVEKLRNRPEKADQGVDEKACSTRRFRDIDLAQNTNKWYVLHIEFAA